MTDFSKILDKAKELEAKMKESQEKIKQIEVVGSSGGDAIKVTLNGDGEMTNIEIGDEILSKLYNAVAIALAYIYKLDKGEKIDKPEIEIPDDLIFDEFGNKNV